MSKGEPIPYDDALRIAKKHLINIMMMDSVEKIAIVGSLRRKKKEVKDIDYQIVGNRSHIHQYFYDKRWKVIEDGLKRAIYQAQSGLYVNCFYTDSIYWGAALMHNTGPRTYNIRKRFLIKKRDMILNQYGLYQLNVEMDRDGDDELAYKLVANETEKDIYDYLGWAYCKPEDRK